MSNTYFKAMSVMGCEIGGITRRSLCRHNCCDGENCVTWLEKQFAKLNEYEEAKAEGRLVVLPCKVGDTVWFKLEGSIDNGFVSWFEWIDDNWAVAVDNPPKHTLFFDFDDFGKTVFLTREAAEKALGGVSDGN